MPDRPVRVGLVTSVGRTLDAFFPAIVERLEERGFAVSSASGTQSRLPAWTPLAGFSQRPSWSVPTAIRAVRAWSRELDHDVVITNTATASALVRAARLRAPVIYFCHGLHWGRDTEPGALPWRVVETALLRRTAGVITINRDDQAWFERHGGPRVHRLPYGVGVPLEDYPQADVPDGSLDLLWVGDFTPRKRPLLAVAVIRRLVDRGCDVRLRMLGDGPLHTAVLREIAAQGLDRVIRADGRGRVAPALASATALLHTAEWEGLPRVALEAAAVGRWSYGFDVKGLRDAPLVRVAPDGDVDSLARLIQDDDARGALREVPDVRTSLSVTAAADGIGAAILDTLGRSQPAHRDGSRPTE
ncbi:glycosyltransferase [Blastococcus mobilis]|uniref:glycosyltransferase n=1 Tax=Blastococcus mobilis TaxID=1938746 RepID=UPI001131A84B|nr:glycosyltransferase [Blastococcus mobilis]